MTDVEGKITIDLKSHVPFQSIAKAESDTDFRFFIGGTEACSVSSNTYVEWARSEVAQQKTRELSKEIEDIAVRKDSSECLKWIEKHSDFFSHAALNPDKYPKIQNLRNCASDELAKRTTAALDTDKLDEAEAMLDRFESTDPQHAQIEALRSLLSNKMLAKVNAQTNSLLKKGRVLLAKRIYSEARAAAKSCLDLSKTHQRCSQLIGKIDSQEANSLAREARYLLNGKLFPEARKAAERCLELAEDHRVCSQLVVKIYSQEERISGAVRFDSEVVTGALRSDMFAAFEKLGREYNTPLKRRTFLRSREAKEYKAKLRELKREVLRTTYYTPAGFIHKYYNLKTKSFSIIVTGRRGGIYRFEKNWPFRKQNINDCIFRQMKIAWKSKYRPDPSDIYGVTTTRYWQKLIVRVPEGKALAIEENKDDVDIRLYFKVKKSLLKSKTVGEEGKTTSTYYPEARNVEIHFVNQSSGKTYHISKYR